MSKAGNFCLVKLVLQDCWNSLAYFDIDEEKWPVQFLEQFSVAPKWRIPFSVIIILKPKNSTIAILLHNEKYFAEFILFSKYFIQYKLFSYSTYFAQSAIFVSWEGKTKRGCTETDYSQATYTIFLKAIMFLDYSVHRKTETLLLGRVVGKRKGLCW